MLQSVFDARKRNRTLVESILLRAISIDRGSHRRAKRLAHVLVWCRCSPRSDTMRPT